MEEFSLLVLKIVIALHSNPEFSISDINFVLNLFSTFISDVYNPFLLNELKSSYSNSEDIEYIFNEHRNPFEKFSSN